MRAAEAGAIAAGVSEAQLQARAGVLVASYAQALQPEGPIVVLIGAGNNGRDAWVAAGELARAGRQVRLCLMPRHAIAESELASVAAAGGQVALHAGADKLDGLGEWLGDATVAIDGLLGIGARGAPRAPLSDAV